MIVTEEFDKMLFNAVRKFTVNEHENEVLETISKFVDSMNSLIQIGILPNNKQKWQHYFETYIIGSLAFDYTGVESPFSIDPMILRTRTLDKHFEKRNWGQAFGRPEDILKFEAIVQEDLTQELQELV